jgi:U2-associated protein SR140
MTRRDAETALRELDGVTWGDSALRVGWSKAVPVGVRPLYGIVSYRVLCTTIALTYQYIVVRKSSRSPDRHRARHSRSRSPRRRSSSRDRHDRRRSRSRSRDRYERRRSRSYDRRRSRSRSRRSRSRDAADEVSESFVRAVATQVRGNDATYEASLCEREKANSQYAFLADRKVFYLLCSP